MTKKNKKELIEVFACAHEMWLTLQDKVIVGMEVTSVYSDGTEETTYQEVDWKKNRNKKKRT